MELYLDKRKQRVLDLLDFFEENLNKELSFTMLSDSLNVSDFIFDSVLKEFLVDIELNDLTEEIIFKMGTRRIFVTKVGKGRIKLASLYFQESIDFLILDDVFRNKFISITEFSYDNYVSRTNIYRRVTAIKELLKGYQLKLSNSFKIVGDEADISSFFLQMYYLVFSKERFPFSEEVKASSERLIDMLITQKELKISAALKLKISYLFGIRYMRIQENSFLLHSKLSKKRVPKDAVASVYNSISAFIQQEWDLTGKKNELETNYLVSLLIGENGFYELDEVVTQNQEIRFLTTHFMQTFSSYFKVDKLPNNVEEDLVKELTILHYYSSYFENVVSLNQLTLERKQAFPVYPKIFRFCQKLFQEMKDKNREAISIESQEFLKMRYYYLIVYLVPPEICNPELKIYTDFSLGKNFKKVVDQEILNYGYYNLKIEDTLHEGVDIVISDVLEELPIGVTKSLNWHIPPTLGDWENFQWSLDH
ncbi:helix-turn-helix domain-containing protein [Carnobacterium divergens]|uniref:helix-turn-helix domain-containing protein n=1 Tax=Carnobacterium divergens TaxID=2748 RepID=UPI0007F46B24|nr:helix-turn-helix domain-containing protein [Carnobacterium divergens]SBO16997.1 putative Mga helix-turn-helix domain protein [Carnobacterium divergens]